MDRVTEKAHFLHLLLAFKLQMTLTFIFVSLPHSYSHTSSVCTQLSQVYPPAIPRLSLLSLSLRSLSPLTQKSDNKPSFKRGEEGQLSATALQPRIRTE